VQDVTRVARDTPVDLAIRSWLSAKYSQGSRSEQTIKKYSAVLTRFRAGLQAAGLDLDSDPDTVKLAAEAFVDAVRTGIGAATANQRLAILSSFYTYVLKHHKLPVAVNPVATIDRCRVQAYAGAQALVVGSDPQTKYADLRRRLAAIDRTTPIGARDYALLLVLLQTGRRLSEVAGLRWRDVTVSADQAAVTLRFPRCKGGKALQDTLPVATSEALLAWLRLAYGPDLRRLDKNAPLWLSASRNRSRYGPALGIRSIANICERWLGTSKVHATRHTFAMAMVDAGAKVHEVRDRLGHSSLHTTGRYIAALKSAHNPYGQALEDLFGLRPAE